MLICITKRKIILDTKAWVQVHISDIFLIQQMANEFQYFFNYLQN